ncbi:MAG: response regulator [Lachnospiraceae bacterium]|nr:response regulator [Lachnospiraceae bacterium]
MSLSNVSILVCDDSILARKQLKDVISSFSQEITIKEAANGQEAVDLYKQINPDLIFLDIVMPVKDGISAVQEIIDYDSDAEIIIVSSTGTQTQLKNAIEAGARDFIQKPFSDAQVNKVLKNHLGEE